MFYFTYLLGPSCIFLIKTTRETIRCRSNGRCIECSPLPLLWSFLYFFTFYIKRLLLFATNLNKAKHTLKYNLIRLFFVKVRFGPQCGKRITARNKQASLHFMFIYLLEQNVS